MREMSIKKLNLACLRKLVDDLTVEDRETFEREIVEEKLWIATQDDRSVLGSKVFFASSYEDALRKFATKLDFKFSFLANRR